MINIMEQIKGFIDAPPAPPKKKKEMVVDPLPPLEEDDKTRVLKEVDLKLMSLADLAKKAADQGSVPFYGCSRCRWIRSGCISYKCNPGKFLAHIEKFPEKYVAGEKVLLKEITSKMLGSELIGGGDPVLTQLYLFLSLKLLDVINRFLFLFSVRLPSFEVPSFEAVFLRGSFLRRCLLSRRGLLRGCFF